ncbi:MAG: Holliday junction resolvase RuvX [Bacteroidota bacterium]|nr:Holliday junction resolvase RuvX [Bacteroidota bacterium]
MGIDYGLKRTGIAVTDPMQIIVTGLETKETSTLLDFIRKYSLSEKIDSFVVGYPFVEGGWGDKTFKQKLDKFIVDLGKLFPNVEIKFHDERFSSMRAKEIMLQSGMKKSKRQDKALLDKTSAIVILQEYLGHI